MDRFDKETIHFLSLLFVGATILWYLMVALRARARTDTADSFLRYRSADASSPGLSAEVLNASLMGSAFSLASAIYVFINWAATDGAFVLWAPITWTLGAIVLYVLRGRIFRGSRETWTMHGFLEKNYSSATLMRLASVVTSTVFLLQVTAEVYVGLSVLQVFLGGSIPLGVLCFLSGAVFIGYSAIGGLTAVMITDAVKYKLTVFALLVAGIALFDNGGASAANLIQESLATKFLPTSTQSMIILMSLLALNLPIFITDMSVWQRVGAVSSEKEVTRGLGRFAAMLLPWMTGIIFVGIGFGTYLVPPEGLTVAQAVIGFFSDSLVFVFLLSGLFAALLTTADSYLIAAVQTVIVDWLFWDRLKKVDYNAGRLSPGDQRKMITHSRLGVVIMGAGAVGLGYLFLSSLPNLLDLLFVIFGMQTALAPSVVYALFGRANPRYATAGLVSIVVGGLTAIVCLVLALGGVVLVGVSIGLWSPILVLTLSTGAFVLVSSLGSH